MERTKFSEEQIIRNLQEAEAGARTEYLDQRRRMSEAQIHNSKSKYGGLEILEALPQSELENENATSKRLLADTLPDQIALKDLLTRKYGALSQSASGPTSLGMLCNEEVAGVPCDRCRWHRVCVPAQRRTTIPRRA